MNTITSITKTAFSRKVFLDLSASGHIQIRGAKRLDGWIPVFSTNTKEEAQGLIERHALRERDGSGNYRLHPFTAHDENEIVRVTQLLALSYEHQPKDTSK